MKQILLIICVFIFIEQSIGQTSYTWNGSVSSAATVAANWSPNGIPGPADNATIVTGSNICVFNNNVTVSNLTVTSGTVDLGGYTLTVNGANAIFTSGTVQNGTLTVTGATTTTFGSGPVTMNCIVNVTSGAVTIHNTAFQQTVNITKTGSGNDASIGNNIFNGLTTITNAGSGYLLLANSSGDQFNAAATFNNTGSSNMFVAYSGTNNIFGGVTTFNNNPIANTSIFVSQYSVGTIFNNNILVASNNGQGISFCGGNTSASAILSAGYTISAGVGGFSTGTLALKQFTQTGTTPQNIVLTGNASVNFNASVFNGMLSVTSPNIYTTNSTFNGATVLTKTSGVSTNATTGGNTFNSTLTVNYTSTTGTGYLSFGNGSPDIYNGDVYSNNNSLDRIIFGHGSTNNQFNGNFIITQVGSSAGTTLTWNGGASSFMAAGKTISIGGAGFSTGYFYIQGFTQNGTAPINLMTTGNSVIVVGAGISNNPSVIGGTFTATAANIYLKGGTFNNAVSITKTGGISNHNSGFQNIFNGPLTINQQSNSGYFMLGYNSNDLFNDNITVTSIGNGGIGFGWATGTGTPTLAAGKTVSIGAAGYSAGYLRFGGFTQLGSTPQNLNLTGTSSFTVLNPGTPCTFGGALSVTAPDIFIQGGVFHGATTFKKTGGTNNYNNGFQNIFNGPLTINQQSNTGYLMLGYNANDMFNDNITLTSVGAGGILLGYTSGKGNPTLASGKTILIGAAGFDAGYLTLGQFTQLGSAPMNLPFTGTNTTVTFANNSVIGGDLVVSSPNIGFDGSTFNGKVNATKTGPSGNLNRGGNIFNGPCSITNSSSSYIMLGYYNPDIWSNDVTFTNSGSSTIQVAINTKGNQFNGNIYVNTSGSAQGISFCAGNATATATLAAGKTIQAGVTGLNAGYLILKQFTQLGNTPVNLTLNSPATTLQFGPGSAFGGNVVSSSPALLFNGCIFSGTVTSVKTGAGNDASIGNNIFNGAATITHDGTGNLTFGNGNSDQFNAAATFNNTGSGNIYVANNSSGNIFSGITTFNNMPTSNTSIYVSWSSSGTIFNDNIIVSSINGQGVQFCGGNFTASATLASGKAISIGSGGFSAGILLLKQFTQIGTTAQSLTLTGSGNLRFGPGSAFGGNVVSSSPGLLFNGCNFSGNVNSVKTGTTNDASSGNNVFNGASIFTNSGSGYLMFGNGNADQFNAASTFNNTGSSYIYVAFNSSNNIFRGVATFNNSPTANTYILVSSYSPGTTFNDDIVVTSSNGQGVQFCNSSSSASAILAAGKTISVGAGGFSAGTLLLRQFTQVGATPQNLSLTGSGNLTFGPESAFGGNVTSVSPAIFFNGCNFSGTVNSVKTGTTNDVSSGNNVFNGASIFTNSGSGYLMFGSGNGDKFNAASTFNNTGSSYIYVAYNSSSNIFGGVTTFNNTPSTDTYILVSSYSPGTTFNDDIIVTSTNGQGVQFCGSSAGASATLAAGKTISVGAGGFSAGTLWLRQFRQVGPTPQILSLSGSGNLTFGPNSAFGGNVTSVSPTLYFNGCIFSGSLNSVKTGTTSDASQGNNIFKGAGTFTNNGTGYLLMAISSPDAYNSDVTFVKNNTGLVYPNYNHNSTYSGNLTVLSTTPVTFGASSGTASFNGTGLQYINALPGTPTPVFTRLVINKTGGAVNLGSDIIVSNTLTFTKANIQTDTYKVIIPSTGTVNGAGQSTGWVNGNLQKNVARGASVARSFEVGGPAYYSPATLLFTSVSSVGDFIAKATPTDHPEADYSGIDTTKSVNRYWSLTNAGVVFSSATATFNWVASDVDAGANTLNFITAAFNGADWLLNSVANPLSISIDATGCTSFGDFQIGEPLTQYLWTGNAMTSDWHTRGNWSGGVPTARLNTIIPSGLSGGKVYPILNSGTGIVKEITIQSAATLTVNGATLQIIDTISNSGILDVKEGSIEMKGTSPQTLAANTFKDNALNHLIINNSSASGVSLGGPLDLYGSLTYKGSGRVFNTNDTLTLKSNAANTAWVGDLTGNSIIGKVTVERYNSQHKAWRFLSIPTNTTQTIKEAWQEGGTSNTDNPVPGYGVQLTGPGGLSAGFDLFSATPSIKTYNPLTNNWDAIANTNLLKLNSPGGYLVFIRGNRLSNAFNSPVTETILRTKGPLNTGPIGPISVLPDKFTTIGNPYASPIDFTKITRTNGVDEKFYVWDPFIPGYYNLGGYQTMSATNNWEPVPGGSTTYPTGVPCTTIQSGQAFLVHATTVDAFLPANYEVYFKEDNKVNGNGISTFSRPGGTAGRNSRRQFFRTSLYTGSSSTAVIADGNVVAFDESFSSDIDGNDALKIAAAGENFDVKRNNKLLSIEGRNRITDNDTIYYNISRLAAKTYQLRFAPVNMGSEEMEAYLIDNHLNTQTPVSLTTSSFVNITVTGDAKSGAADRFKVVFKRMAVLPVTFTSISAAKKGKDIIVQWTAENESDIQQYEVERSLDGIQFTKVATHAANSNGSGNYSWLDEKASSGNYYYRVRSVGQDGQVQYTQIVKVLIEKFEASMAVYPNPILNGSIQIQFTNQPAGVYRIKLLNSLGQVILSKAINHSDGNSTKVINPDHKLAKGIYQLEVVKPGGVVEVMKVVN